MCVFSKWQQLSWTHPHRVLHANGHMEAFCVAKWHNKTPMWTDSRGPPRYRSPQAFYKNVSDINKTRAHSSHHYPRQKHEFSHDATTNNQSVPEYKWIPKIGCCWRGTIDGVSYLNFEFADIMQNVMCLCFCAAILSARECVRCAWVINGTGSQSDFLLSICVKGNT